DLGLIGDHVQDRGDELLEYAAEAACAGLVLKRNFGDLLEDEGLDRQLDSFVAEQLAKLRVDRVLRFDHDPDQHLAAQITEVGDDRQSSGELGYQAIGKQVGRLDARVQPVENFLVVIF